MRTKEQTKIIDRYITLHKVNEERLQRKISRDEFMDFVADTYSKLLQADEDYRTTDEYIKETIECNDYDFLENGKMFN